jgi:hypothetical protein
MAKLSAQDLSSNWPELLATPGAERREDKTPQGTLILKMSRKIAMVLLRKPDRDWAATPA